MGVFYYKQIHVAMGITFVFSLDKNTLEIMNKEPEERRSAAKEVPSAAMLINKAVGE